MAAMRTSPSAEAIKGIELMLLHVLEWKAAQTPTLTSPPVPFRVLRDPLLKERGEVTAAT